MNFNRLNFCNRMARVFKLKLDENIRFGLFLYCLQCKYWKIVGIHWTGFQAINSLPCEKQFQHATVFFQREKTPRESPKTDEDIIG